MHCTAPLVDSSFFVRRAQTTQQYGTSRTPETLFAVVPSMVPSTLFPFIDIARFHISNGYPESGDALAVGTAIPARRDRPCEPAAQHALALGPARPKATRVTACAWPPGQDESRHRTDAPRRGMAMACHDGAERHGWVARPRPSLTSQPASQPHRRSRRGPRGTKRRGGRTEERRCRALLLSPAAPDSDSPLLVGFSEASRVLILVESDGSV